MAKRTRLQALRAVAKQTGNFPGRFYIGRDGRTHDLLTEVRAELAALEEAQRNA